MENDSGMVKKTCLGESARLRADSPKSYVGQLKKEDRERESPPIPRCAHRGLPPAGEARGEKALTETGKDITIPEEYQRESAGDRRECPKKEKKMKNFDVAIDGPSGAGKSSLARRCAAELGLLYVDTGAIYRTVGLAALRRGVDPKKEEAVAAILPELEIGMGYEDGEQRMYLNGEDVSREIRMPEISMYASDVSAHAAVRSFLLEMQRKLARENCVIMDGRDIGTVVLPEAKLKIYLTASPEARAERRMKELVAKGVEQPYEEVLRDIIQRDEQDMNREVAPLRQAEDAVLVDTTEIDFDQSFELLCGIIRERMEAEA